MSRPVRRLAALGLLLLLLGLANLAVVAPLVSAWSGTGAAIRSAAERLERFTAIAAEKDHLAAALEARRALPGQGSGHYDAPSETLAAAQLQERLKAVVEQAGGALASIRVMPAGDDPPFRRIALRAQVEAPLPVLQRILHGLESGRPWLVLDNLSVRATRPAGRLPAKAEPDPPLTIQFDVIAFARIAR